MADHDADAGAGRTFRPLQATAFPYRIDFGLRDSAMHQLVPSLDFRQLPKEWPDCDGQIHWFFVCNGSQAGTHQPSPDDCDQCAGDPEPGRFQLRRGASVGPPY